MSLELMLMQAAVEDRRRQLEERLRHARYGTGVERARWPERRRLLPPLRRVLPGLRALRRAPA